MKRVIFYGAGEMAKKFLSQSTDDYIVTAIADRNYEDTGCLCGHEVISPDRITDFEYEQVIITLDDLKKGNDKIIFEIFGQLREMGIPEEKIILQSFKTLEHHMNRFPRKEYLRELSEIISAAGLPGDVAECGVFRGWFSSMINEYFPDKNLWLFDTFEGFDKRDIEADTAPAKTAIYAGKFDRFNTTSEDIVRLRCSHRDRLIFRKGYVPSTFVDVNTDFCFVNLDMDLYAPQLAALNFFAPRMTKGGVILVHDYYNKTFTGTRLAVDEFLSGHSCIKTPIGDGLSIALLF